MEQKKLTKRPDLEGLEIIHKDDKILISVAWESIWKNPNHKDFHGKKVLQIAGYKNAQVKDDQYVGQYVRIDMLESDLVEATE
jgi:hypothetical protein